MAAVRKGLLVIAALAATALISGIAASPASAATTWLCKPGAVPNPCYPDLTTTVVGSDGASRIEADKPARKPKFDCFYVYPTVSDDQSTNADIAPGPEETSIALYQAARFSEVCRVWAPMYRQLTLMGINGTPPAGALELAYGDVKAAWAEYMRKHNNGRGVVLIGHSQGAGMLQQLVRGKIDKFRSARQRLISAMLLGGNVLVKQGKGVGGVFQKVPACWKPTKTGCVVAYSVYDETPPPDAAFGNPANNRFADIFGLAGRADLEVLCTNPAALGGGSAPLRTLVPTAPVSGTIGVGVNVMYGGSPPDAPTPWVEPQDHYNAACVRENGAHVLKTSPIGAARNLNAVPDASWGLHLADVNIALGNLVDLAGTQGRAYIKQRKARKKKRD